MSLLMIVCSLFAYETWVNANPSGNGSYSNTVFRHFELILCKEIYLKKLNLKMVKFVVIIFS